MDQFFEAWVEIALRRVAQKTGAQVKVGRKRETTHPITWAPPYWGSQKSLMPDLWLEWSSITMIVDAKYKRHWEELQEQSWSRMQEELREQHRNDLLQVLAYANLARTQTVIACLAYPCSAETWKSLRDRGRLFHRAEVTAGPRSLHLWLTAFPMNMGVEHVAAPMTEQLRSVLEASELH
jgi:5-methylcytosine-specific restriction endonuclease McrBC regulatory subunit McrC